MEKSPDYMEAGSHPVSHSLWSEILCRGDLKTMKQCLLEPERQTLGSGVARPQLATYPQSPSSGPVRCCDVTDLSQAFSQPPGPGRLWISLGAILYQPINLKKTTHTQKS